MKNMNKLYLDCEFNGFNGELISMAIVVDNGETIFYEVMPLPEQIDPWVAKNVIPKLNQLPVDSKEIFIQRFHNFMRHFDGVEIYADSFQDFIYFFECFKGETYLESLDITCKAVLVNSEGLTFKPTNMRHNALIDALSLKEALHG
jgi:hypothetical protein